MSKEENLVFEALIQSNIKYNRISKLSFNKGRSIVYDIDNKYIIKIAPSLLNNQVNILESKFYETFAKENIAPKVITKGIIQNHNYFIMEKIAGTSLLILWHNLSEAKKRKYTKKFADGLRQIHKLDIKEYAKENNLLITSWSKSMQNLLNTIIAKVKEFNINTTKLEYISKNVFPIIFEEEKMEFTHGDAHFQNVIVDDGSIKFIDFEASLFASSDRDLYLLKEMQRNPKNFLKKEERKLVQKTDFKNFFELFKEYYPELFAYKYLEERLLVYKLLTPIYRYLFERRKISKTKLEKYIQKIESKFYK